MKILASTCTVALLFVGAAHAQTPPARTDGPAGDLTRDLNSGPPAPATYLAPVPAPAAPAAPVVAPLTRTTIAPAPATSPPAVRPVPVPVQPPVSAPHVVPPRATPTTATPAPQPRAVPSAPSAAGPAPRPRAEPLAVAPDPVPAVAPAPEPSPRPATAPAVTVLDGAARAALPFSAELPPGFEITTGRPGPDFRIYTIRRGGQSFAMVYAGPASQFPIYSGQMIEAGGRASIIATENGVRHAMEHLLQRATAPQEIHVWTMSLDGADRAMAEQIAQSVDAR